MPLDSALLSLVGPAFTFCAESAISGYVGHGAGDAAQKQVEAMQERLKILTPPENHDIQRGVYTSMVQAIVCTCQDELRQMGVPDKKPFSFFGLPRARRLRVAKRAKGDLYVEWFESARIWAQEEIKQAADTDEANEALEDTAIEADALLGSPDRSSTQELRDTLVAKVRARIQESISVEPPASAVAAFKERWPDLFTAFIHEHHKTDGPLRHALSRELLTSLKATQDDIREAVARVLEALEQQTLYKRYRGACPEDALQARLQDLGGRFGGRDSELATMNQFIRASEDDEPSGGLLLITSPMGSGKSALLANWMQGQEERPKDEVPKDEVPEGEPKPFIALHMFHRQYPSLTSTQRAYQNLLAQIYTFFNRKDEPLPSSEADAQDAIAGLLTDPSFEVRPERPLVIVVDALDEADPSRDGQHFYLPIPPRRWPDHVYVIATARANPGRVPTYLRYWARREEATRVDLSPYLPPEAVRDLVAESPEPALQARAQDDAFIRRLHEVTGGYPLYLTHLLDELERTGAQEKDTGGAGMSVDPLSSVPDSFAEYVRDRLNLDGLSETLYDDGQAAKLLDLLAVAEGALSTRDLLSEDLTGYASSRQLEGLPWRVARWLSIRQDEGEAQNGSRLYAFAHPKIAEVYRDGSAGGGVRAQKMLAEYGLRWAETGSRYALRHTARHLRQIGDHDGLYDLLRDEDFRCAQVEAFGGYDATYQAFREGIEAYVDRDGETPEDDARLCRLALDAGLVAQEAQNSVAEAFRWAEEGRMADALQRIEVLDEKRYFLAALRLLWIEADRQVEQSASKRSLGAAKHVLSALEDRIGPGTQTINWRGFVSQEFMEWWSSYVLMAMPELDIRSVLMHSSRLNQVARVLATTGDLKHALEVAESISSASERACALSEVARALAAAGDNQQARAVLGRVLKVADRTDSDLRASDEIVLALSNITKALLAIGDSERARSVLGRALEIAGRILDSRVRVCSLSEIAKTYAAIGDSEQARSALSRALEIAGTRTFLTARGHALSEVAETYAAIGDSEQARSVLGRALEIAGTCTSTSSRAYVLSKIPKTLAAIGDIEQAREVAESIGSASERVHALSEVAKRLTAAGEVVHACSAFETALEDTETTHDRMYADALAKIAKAIGNSNQARSLLGMALKVADRIGTDRITHGKALVKIAGALAATGDSEKALEVAERIGTDVVLTHAKALAEIAGSLATTGDSEKALEVAERISTDGVEIAGLIKVLTLSEIAKALAAAGDNQQARAVLGRALKSADRIDGDRPRILALSEIAKALAAAGDNQQAHAVLGRALKVADRTDSDLRASDEIVLALSDITKALSTVGDSERARSVLGRALAMTERIQDLRAGARALHGVAGALSAIGDSEQARCVFEKAREKITSISHGGKRAEAVSHIALHLAAYKVVVTADEISEFVLSRDEWSDYLSTWREAVLHHEGTPIPRLRKSFMLYPFDLEVSFGGIYTLVQAHVQAGTMEYARAIVRRCPELGLDILLQGFE